ncbi:MAG: hypothetical protein K6E29_02890 [Cyanobacteria bacterium RUI128]|nr:hypothetical protein [Cyanobacteria bacterium RUI128]
MNIRTNYPIQQMQMRSNQNSLQNKSVSVPEHNAKELASSSVCFTGLGDLLRRGSKVKGETKELIEFASQVLGCDAGKVAHMAEGKKPEQFRFLAAMTEHFNAQNFYAEQEKRAREDGNVVLELFNRILKPKAEHHRMVEGTNLRMTDIKKCFDFCEDDPKKINQVFEIYQKIPQIKGREELIADMVESPNAGEYIENFDKYLPHFAAQKEVKGAVANLDKQLGSSTLDLRSDHIKKNVARILKEFPENRALKAEDFAGKYNDEGASLISSIRIKLAPTAESIESGDAKGILRIFGSTTKENAKFRSDFLEANYHNYGKRDEVGKNEINEIAGLFELADKDPNAMQFLSRITADERGLGRAGGFLDLFDKFGAERLNAESKQISKIIGKNHWSPLEKVIDYLENGSSSVVSKVVGSFKGLFRSKPAQITPVRDIVTIDTMDFVPTIKPSVNPVTIISEAAPKAEKPVVSAPVIQAAEPVKKAKRSYLTFKPYVPKAPNAKKLLVINDVNGIIEKKLGSKVLDEQSKIYANKATKMRASMLPEIFESIKDTRATERAKGTFSRTKSVSNKDAVDLYTRINGKNKKLVNYMLKKRNADGTRMFSIRDILDTLADANREIIAGQSKSTKLNRFTAKDERAIYDNIFDQKIAEFGKLQRVRSKKA